MKNKIFFAVLFSFVILITISIVRTEPQVRASADDKLTVVASTTLVDNLIGASNTEWVFTATTSAEIATGDVVQFIFPTIANNAQPFDVLSATLASTSNIALYANPSAPNQAQGVTGGNGTGDSRIVWGYATSTVPTGTTFTVMISGITNAGGSLWSMTGGQAGQNGTGLNWALKAGTLNNGQDPNTDSIGNTKFSSTTKLSLVRAGHGLFSDSNSSISASSNVPGATNVTYTFSITASSTVPIGGKIVINFPTEFSLQNATTTAIQTVATGGSGDAKVAKGAIATSSGQGNNKAILTVSNAAIDAGDLITVSLNGLTNPATAGVYRPFFIYTTKSNGGLIDGSYFGFENSDYSGGTPPPNDTIYIGGKNTLHVVVKKKLANGTISDLSGAELTQVKVMVGCPDKQFSVGAKYLESDSTATFSKILDCNYMVGTEPFNKGDSTFYDSFLAPGMKSVNLVGGDSGQESTTTITFGVPDSTAKITITDGVSGQKAFVNAFSADYQSFSPVYTDTTYATEGFDPTTKKGYVKLKVRSGQSWNFTVEGGQFGSAANFVDSSGFKRWPPVIPSFSLASASTSAFVGSFPYIIASSTLNVILLKDADTTINNACVGVKRSGGGMFMGAQDSICAQTQGVTVGGKGAYQFKVPPGAISIEISRPGYGKPEEYPVSISEGTTNKTIYLSSPTSYILVNVVDSSGTVIMGAPVSAHGSNGFANGMTSNVGSTTIYVQPGTYTVDGFAPAFGRLTPQTAVVTNSSNPTVTFTVDTGALKTIKGTVTQNSTGLAGVKIGARGINGTNGGNGAETDSEGKYTLYVPAGVYEVGGWSSGTGGLSPITPVDVSSSNATGKDWTLGALGTLQITVINATSTSPIFAGVFNPTTGRGNGTESWMSAATGKIATLTLPEGTYDVHVGSPSLGEFGSSNTVEILGGQTTTKIYNASSGITPITLSGTVLDGDGVAVSSANIWASRINGPGFFSTQTDSTGAYSISMPGERSYRMGVRSSNYVSDQGDVQVDATTTNAVKNFTLTSAASTISGQVLNVSSVAVTDGWVMAVKNEGSANETRAGGPTDSTGRYSIPVDSGAWNLYADGPCYNRSTAVSATAGDSSKNITLTARSGCTVTTPEVQAVTAASGGQISKPGITLDIPENALGSGQTSVSVSVGTADTVVSSANATPLKGSVKSITASNGTQSITQLSSNVSLTIAYDPTELPTGFNEADLRLGYFDSTTGQWEPVAATVDTVNNTLTASVSHFTDYGPILPGVPDAPLGLTATVASASSISLAWSAAPSADSYTIYRSLTDSNFTTAIATGITAVSYSDTGLSASTKYYYKVAGVNDNGEGSNSTSANATTNAAAAAAVTTSSSSSGSSGYANRLLLTLSPSPFPSPALAVSSLTVPERALLAEIKRDLERGMNGNDVIALQTILAKDRIIYPEGSITGFFGPATERAVKRFQAKYGISQVGRLGPATLAKLISIYSTVTTLSTPSVKPVVAPSTATSSVTRATEGLVVFTQNMSRGSFGDFVKRLQQLLNSDKDTIIASEGLGSLGNETTLFGELTEKAVKKFQVKYKIANEGDSGYGTVGPMTRGMLQELFGR